MMMVDTTQVASSMIRGNECRVFRIGPGRHPRMRVPVWRMIRKRGLPYYLRTKLTIHARLNGGWAVTTGPDGRPTYDERLIRAHGWKFEADLPKGWEKANAKVDAIDRGAKAAEYAETPAGKLQKTMEAQGKSLESLVTAFTSPKPRAEALGASVANTGGQ